MQNRITNVEDSTSDLPFGKPLLSSAFSSGDKIIWDSGFGYELGVFLSENNAVMNSYTIDLVTGKCQGSTSRDISEIKHYSVELAIKLTKKYKCYFKDFDDRIYFKTQGQEPNVDCIEPCPIVNTENTSQIMIGSCVCQKCPNHLFNNQDKYGDISWIVCSKLLGGVRQGCR